MPEEPNPGDGDSGTTPPAPEGTSEARFTQADLNRIAAREKDDGRKSGTRELLDSLGFKDIDEAKDIIQQHRKANDDALSETEKARQQAEKDKQSAATAKAEAATERLVARVERALLRAGVEDKNLERVSKMLNELQADSSPEDITTAVDELKTELPALFTPGKPDEGTPSSDPGKPPKGKPGASAGERAKSLLAERHPKTVKAS